MDGSQFHISQFVNAFRRRWKLVVLTPVIVAIACAIIALSMTRKYESSTTILVRPDETLAPLPGYDMMMAFEEQLRNINEILYSRVVLQAALDSLDMIDLPSATDVEIFAKMKEIQGNISTMRLGSDSFRLTYTDTDPVRAKRGAEVVASIFIKYKIQVENRQNTMAVQFYEEKVEEYRKEFEASARSIVSSMRQNVQDTPFEDRGLYALLDELERSLNGVDIQIASMRKQAQVLQSLPERIQSNPEDFRLVGGRQELFEIARSELPYATDLRTLLGRYEELTRRYKGSFPEVVRAETELIEILRRIRTGADAELTNLMTQRSQIEKRRSTIIDDLKKTSVAQQQNAERASLYDTKRRQYEEIKAKLEQARLARDVGDRGANQFIILDPAAVPILPTKPKRTLIVIGGFIFGLFLGIVAAFVAEVFDTTIRKPADVAHYGKPIIAFLPEWGSGNIQRK